METTIQKPTEQQALAVANQIKDKHLHNWHVKDIVSGIVRVGITRLGLVQDVYIAPGMFSQLSYCERGDQRWKSFELNGWTVRRWSPK